MLVSYKLAAGPVLFLNLLSIEIKIGTHIQRKRHVSSMCLCPLLSGYIFVVLLLIRDPSSNVVQRKRVVKPAPTNSAQF